MASKSVQVGEVIQDSVEGEYNSIMAVKTGAVLAKKILLLLSMLRNLRKSDATPVVVTRNTRDFIDLQINVENWEN